MSDDLPQITDERLGEMIMNAIMYSHLFEPECPECGRRGGMVVVWAANAPEQIGAFVREHFPLVCGAPPLLKIAQKLLLWMEECMAACDFNQDDMDLYHELRQTIRTAGGFSSETHWWQGPCICSACGHAWRGVVEIPVEATSPQVPLECGECHQMTGGPA